MDGASDDCYSSPTSKSSPTPPASPSSNSSPTAAALLSPPRVLLAHRRFTGLCIHANIREQTPLFFLCKEPNEIPLLSPSSLPSSHSPAPEVALLFLGAVRLQPPPPPRTVASFSPCSSTPSSHTHQCLQQPPPPTAAVRLQPAPPPRTAAHHRRSSPASTATTQRRPPPPFVSSLHRHHAPPPFASGSPLGRGDRALYRSRSGIYFRVGLHQLERTQRDPTAFLLSLQLQADPGSKPWRLSLMLWQLE